MVEKVFRSFGDDWEEWAFQIDEILDAGECVIALGKYYGRHKSTGKSFTAAAAHVYSLRGGSYISAIHRYGRLQRCDNRLIPHSP